MSNWNFLYGIFTDATHRLVEGCLKAASIDSLGHVNFINLFS